MNQQQKIPEGWKENKLGNLVNIFGGKSPSNFNLFCNGKYPYLKVEDLNNCEKYQKYSRNYSNEDHDLIPKNSIIFPKRGAAILLNKIRICKIVSHIDSNLMAVSIKNTNILYTFLYYRLLKDKLYKIADSSTIPQINNIHINPYKISIPSLLEQKCIVEILETWDKYLKKLDQKIKIKKNVKKGLMQNLLTGKIRLIEYKKEWEITELKEICNIEKGKALSSKDLENGDYPVIAGGKTSPYSHNKFTHENVVTISASGAYAGYISYHENKIWASDCSVVKQINGKSDINFLYYFLQNKQKQIYSLQSGGAQPHIYPKDIGRIKLAYPNTREQNAIADILVAADKEIETLEKEREIVKNQKKYLLNNLITGQIRLPEFINKN